MALNVSSLVGGRSHQEPITADLVTGQTALLCAVEPLETLGAARLRQRAEAVTENCRCLILDLQAVEFLDSDGVRMLLELARTLDSRGAELLLVTPPQSLVRRTIELFRLQSRLRVFPRLDDALAARRPLV